VSIGTESKGKQCDSGIVKTNIQCDPTEKLHVKTKWSDVVASGSTGRRKEDSTSNRIFKSNITSASKEQWKTVNRGHKKPPTVNQASYYQILVVIHQYELLRHSRKDEQMAHEPMKTRAGDEK